MVEVGEQGWLSPGVKGVGAASLLSDVGHEVPTSLLPRLLTGTLGAPAAALGFIEGLADALAGLSRLGGGVIADNPRRRRSIAVGGYASTAILTSLIGTATAVWQVGALRAAGWASRGLRTPARNALLAESVPAAAYGRAYGFERAMDNLGAIIGPLLAIALVSVFSVRTAILLSVIPGLLAVGAMAYAIVHIPRSETLTTKIQLQFRAAFSGLKGLFASIGAFEVGNVAATLLILRATELLDQRGTIATATTTALMLYVGYNVAASLASFIGGRWLDTRGAVAVLRGGFVFFAIAYAAFAVAGPNVAVLAAAFLLAGIGIGFVETAEHAAVAHGARPEVRGSAFGLLAGTQSFGNLLASSIVGGLWTLASPSLAFGYLVAWMIVAVALSGFAPAGSET
jgi:MFS family permease